jgi:hypothetical protein
MSQPDMLSQSPANASSIVDTDVVDPKGDPQRHGNRHHPRTGRKTPSLPKIHCFEFNALQAQRRLLLANVLENIAVSGKRPGFAYQSVILEDDVLADAAAQWTWESDPGRPGISGY